MPSLDPRAPAALDVWMRALEARHLHDLTFQEVARSLRALSSCYVERRHRIASGQALEGAGKRAAFALFYAPLHFLLTSSIVEAVQLSAPRGATVIDLGCGTGAAGAACALTMLTRGHEGVGGAGNTGTDTDPGPLLGIDRNPWAAREAEWSWRTLGLRGRAVQGDVERLRWPRGPKLVVAAFTVNELASTARTRLRDRLIGEAAAGHAVLVVEPLARASAPWWDEWARCFKTVGGVERSWRLAPELPDLVRRLDAAAGLNHRELTGRSLHVGP